MSEISPPPERPPLWRNATVLAVGVVLLLALIYGVGVLFGRHASPVVSKVAAPPPAAVQPPAPAPVVEPAPALAPAPPPTPVAPPAPPPAPVAEKPAPIAVPPHGPKHPLHHHQAEAARARGTWTVQIGAFRTQAGAAAMVHRLERRQIHAVVRRRREKSGEDWFLVQIDRLPTRQAAEAAAGSVAAKTHLPTLILHDVPVLPDSKAH